jgi:hypothetical protein
MLRSLKWMLAGLLLALVTATPVSMAQAPAPVTAPPNLYSIWVRLSLRGLNQAEIESQLRHMDRAALAEVKARLRNTVLANLESKRVGQRYLTSRDSDDLKGLRTAIETEVRFVGLTHDQEIRLLIRSRFGIPVDAL